ncbi:hypothetical protein T492DRAFT_1007855 [Pavlovales sp. CCMP2436]|nr:hypothetical protein T492DRAFT_1007855 [Pavlovales sp. CCMP2436]
MLSFLTCIGLDAAPRCLGGAYETDAATVIGKHARASLARREAEALRKNQAERLTARVDIRRTLKKQSRQLTALYSTRLVYLTADESSLVYAKTGQADVEKTLPFAQMEPPAVSGSLITLTMRNQAPATAVIKFQAATEAEAKVWAHAITIFLPPSLAGDFAKKTADAARAPELIAASAA